MSDTTSLLPPNATTPERALSSCTARTTALAVGPKYRALWSPETCPAGTLPWLAWALHVDEWDSNWTEQQKRDVIAASVVVHKTKGTIGALKRALSVLGYEVTVDEATGQAYTFRLEFDLNQTGIIGTGTFAAARRVAMANKNARSKLLAVRSSLTETAGVYGAVAHHRAQTVTVIVPPVIIATSFGSPRGVAQATNGTDYVVTDYSGGRLLNVTNAGIVTVIATSFGSPRGVAQATNGTDYVVTEYYYLYGGRLLNVTNAGIVTVIATSFGSPYGVAQATNGTDYVVTDYSGRRLLNITNAGVVTVIVGG